MQRVPIIGQSSSGLAVETVLRAALEASGSELSLEAWERKPHQLDGVLDELRATPDVAGALLLAPFKDRAAGMVDALSADARASGATNVVVRDGDRLRGHNTDVDGVRAGLKALLPRDRGAWPKGAVVLGAGGGARAVVAVLVGAGFAHVTVFNRHLHRAEALVAHFGRAARQMELRARPWHESVLEAELARAGVMVNASGSGTDATASAVDPAVLPDGLVLLDLVLERGSTPLMREASAREGRVANGQAAFLASTAATYRLLSGAAAPAAVMKAALADVLGMPEEHVAVVGD